MSTITRPPESPPGDAAPAIAGVLKRVRAAWRRAVLARGLVMAPALVLACALLLLLVDLVAPLPTSARLALRWFPGLLGVGVAAWTVLRMARPPADRRLALLAEERIPALENRLATALDLAGEMRDGVIARAFLADVEGRLRGIDLRAVAPVRVRRPAAVAAGCALLLGLFAIAFPAQAREAWRRWAAPRDAYEGSWREARARVLPAVAEPPIPGFDELRWTVTPPAYSGLPATSGPGDEPVSALAGSRVRLRSRFAPRWSAVRANRVGSGALPVRRSGGEWSVEWTVGAAERGLSLDALAGDAVIDRRVVPVLLVPDRPPDVSLTAPEADMVLPAAAGRLEIRAAATDDHGLADLRLTWIRSRGTGELFQFQEGEWRWTALRRSGRGLAGEHTVELATLGLQPGDVVHIRAVARDRNDVTGPGESVSRTRIVRIARENELDQVDAVLSLPPEMPRDPVLSQRMLVLLTERLERRAPSLARAALLEEAGHLGHEQGRLRERVGEQIFTRGTSALQSPDAGVVFEETEGAAAHQHAEGEGQAQGEEKGKTVEERASEATGRGTEDEIAHRHDEAPLIGMNRDLLALYNLMWASERELNQGAPGASLPHQRRALEMIQRMRTAERVFARGQVRVDPVDIAAARGEGKIDEAAPAPRRPAPAGPSRAPLLAELDRALASLGARDRRSASLTLSALAARVLADSAADRGAAPLLSRAAGAASAGRTAQARELAGRARALLSAAGGTAAPPLPSTADPAAAEYFRRLGRGGSP